MHARCTLNSNSFYRRRISRACQVVLGWKYVETDHADQGAKEGRLLLERARLIKLTRDKALGEWVPAMNKGGRQGLAPHAVDAPLTGAPVVYFFTTRWHCRRLLLERVFCAQPRLVWLICKDMDEHPDASDSRCVAPQAQL
jgi:hypothetical protein